MTLGAIAASALLILLLSIPLWKPLVYRFKWGIVAANAYQDLLRRCGLVRGQIGNPYTKGRHASDIPEVLNAIHHTFVRYLQAAQTAPGGLEGARVLEIGPGNDLGVALRFIAEGASSVVAMDRFVPLQDTPFQRKLYGALREQLSPEKRLRFDDAIQLDSPLRLNPKRLLYLSGRGIEEAESLFAPRSFDLIVSNAVMEEVFDADVAFRAMDDLLRPGGRMIHVIDLGDYGMFSKHGFHPLEFLTVPDAIYRCMAESVGQPNRRLVDYYRATMASLGYTSTIQVTSMVGASKCPGVSSGPIHQGLDEAASTRKTLANLRPRLLDRYRRLGDGELLIAGIVLEAQKPRKHLESMSQP